jgi:acyl carrier protein
MANIVPGGGVTMSDSVEHRCLLVMARTLEIDPECLTPDVDLVADLNIESVRRIELEVMIEEEFQVEFDIDAIFGLGNTVKDIIDFTRKEVSRQHGTQQ